MIVGFFGIASTVSKEQNDRPFVPRLHEMIGQHQVKLSLAPTMEGCQFFHTFAARAKKAELDVAIVTDAVLLWEILKALPDYKQAFHKNGSLKAPSLNDYHGSYFRIPASRVGSDKDLPVLILNPLSHLRTVPEADFVFRRFISKITKPEKWFPQTQFTWEQVHPENAELLTEIACSAIALATDIETPEDVTHRTMDCVGFAWLLPDRTTHSIVFPWEPWAYPYIKRILASSARKIFQNGLYDNAYLMRWNMPAEAWLYDTQHLFHSWYAELPKRLDFITAFSIREIRFWKDDGHTGGTKGKYEYNARDCHSTLMAWCALILEAPDWAKTNYLQEFPLVFPCLSCELDGIAADKEKFDLSLAAVTSKLKAHEAKLAAWISPDFNCGSHIQVKNLLKVLGCANKAGIVESSDDKSLQAAAFMHPFVDLIVSEIQKVREYRKLISTYLVWDKMWNSRLHYKINPAGTDSGRLASMESSFWCGLQIQNQPRGPEVKSWLKADDGFLLGENDYSQSEARCVGYISGCKSLIELVEGPHDYHSWNAQSFFGIPYEQIYDEAKKKTLMKDIRDLSKRTNHGANYNMGAAVMLQTMGPKAVTKAKDVLQLPPRMSLLEVCQYLLSQYAKTYPEVKKDYQEWIVRTVGITKKLVSALGWTRHTFLQPSANKLDLNSLVAHVPQNLSVGIINRCFYRAWRASVYDPEFRGSLRIKAQIHDSILYAYREDRHDIPDRVKLMMTEPVPVKDIKGVTRTLLIPTDVSAGKKYWSELK